MRHIAKRPHRTLYIIVNNPVDIITYVFMKISGIPENQIIGSGTALDTARLRFGLASHFNIAQRGTFMPYVFGEHGDSSFIPWSCAEVSGAKLVDYVELMHAPARGKRTPWRSMYINPAARSSRTRAPRSTRSRFRVQIVQHAAFRIHFIVTVSTIDAR